MATKGTSKTYEEILAEENAAGKKTYNETAAKTKGAAAQKIANQNAVIDGAAQNTAAQYQKTIDEAPKRFAAQLDDNYIDELVARKNLENSMADMGLTDSGLNRGQQTAISVMRGNADAKTRQQQQDYITAAQQAIDQVLAEAEQKKASHASEINAGTEDYLAQLWTTVQQNARANATSRYNAQLEAEAEAEEQALKLQYGLMETLIKEGMSYDDAYRTVFGNTTSLSDAKHPIYDGVASVANIPRLIVDAVRGAAQKINSVTGADNGTTTEQPEESVTLPGVDGVISGGYNTVKSWADTNLAKALKNGTISKERAAESLYAQVIGAYGVEPHKKLALQESLKQTPEQTQAHESASTALWNIAYDLGIEDEMAEVCEVSLDSVPTKYTGGRIKSRSSGVATSKATKPATTATAKTEGDGLLGWIEGFFSDYNTR